MTKTNFYSLSFDELYDLLENEGLNPHGARVLFNWFYKKRMFGELPADLARETKSFLINTMSFEIPSVVKDQQMIQNNIKATQKFLVQLCDHQRVECVLIPFQGKYTLCLSSQVGCAMKCSFCFTGKQGLSRQLETHEIVGQLMSIHQWLNLNQEESFKITNLVFMGQGEPLHNFKAVKKACDIFLSQYGLSLGRDKITISTAGYLPGLEEWQRTDLRVNLALSLHSTKREVRDELIPLNRAYPLPTIIELLKSWPLEKKKFITIEYLMIDNLNDGESDAHELAQTLGSLRVIINIIPFNPIPDTSYQRPDDTKVNAFHSIIQSYNLPCMVRKTKGDDILAACGQLNSQ